MNNKERIVMMENNLRESYNKLQRNEITREQYSVLKNDVDNRIKEIKAEIKKGKGEK